MEIDTDFLGGDVEDGLGKLIDAQEGLLGSSNLRVQTDFAKDIEQDGYEHGN